MSARRVASIGSALVVAGIAFLASYSHMRGLALRYGQTEVIADLLPVSVDGMLVVATVALGDGRRHRWSAWVAFWTGVAASVVANVLAAEPSAIARCISAWPAIAFLLVVEVITRGGRIRAREVDTQQDTQPDSEPVPAALPQPPIPATPVDTTPVTPAASKRTPGRPVKAAKPASNLATQAAKVRARKPDITQADLAAKLGVSERTLRRRLNESAPDSEPATGPVNGHDVPALITTT